MKSETIGLDFDATIAAYQEGKFDPNRVGEPIAEMVSKVKAEMARGTKFIILTARVYPGLDYQRALDATRGTLLIAQFCQRTLGTLLPVTFVKLPCMAEIWDDKARQVVPNHGVFATELLEAAQR